RVGADRGPPLVIDVRQVARQFRWQGSHASEEPPVGRVRAETTVERYESRRIVRPDGSKTHPNAAAKHDGALELFGNFQMIHGPSPFAMRHDRWPMRSGLGQLFARKRKGGGPI